MQRALIQYRDPENYDLVKEALLREGREDLIGFGEKCLIPPRKIVGLAKSSKSAERAERDKRKNGSKEGPGKFIRSAGAGKSKGGKHEGSGKSLKTAGAGKSKGGKHEGHGKPLRSVRTGESKGGKHESPGKSLRSSKSDNKRGKAESRRSPGERIKRNTGGGNHK